MKKVIELTDDKLEYTDISVPESKLVEDRCSSNGKEIGQNHKVEKVYRSFTKLPDGSLVEQLYDPAIRPKVFFARYKNGEISYHEQIALDDETILCPINNSIVETNTILFPSKAIEYENEEALIEEIRSLIHKNVAVPTFNENLAAFYVMFTWVFDDFTVLPYLKFLGDYGSGKSTVLLTTGALCYKPIFCSGAATTSPIFRLIDQFGGTLIIDEGDWDKNSDEHSRLIKILNTGFQRGFPVIISEPPTKGSKLYEPRAYNVYGPKLIASRRRFRDEALESRCMTTNMDGSYADRTDIPPILGEDFWREAREIRNKLLMFRLKNLGSMKLNLDLIDPAIEPRLNQVTLPLKSIMQDRTMLRNFEKNVREFNQSLRQERGESYEGEILDSLVQLWNESEENIIIRRLADRVNSKVDAGEKPITAHTVGRIVGRTFGIDKERTSHGYIVKRSAKNANKIRQLIEKYGIEETLTNIPVTSAPSSQVHAEEDNSLSF